jgi:hypothetical protein
MLRTVLPLLVLASTSAIAAPAPFVKPASPSAKRVWQIDLAPLWSAPDRPFTLTVTVSADRGSNSSESRQFRLRVQGGKVARVNVWHLVRTPSGYSGGGGTRQALEGWTASEAIESLLLNDLGDGSAVTRGAVVEVTGLWGRPVSEVTVTAEGLGEEYIPVARLAPRPR